jgi:hypothetical protein
MMQALKAGVEYFMPKDFAKIDEKAERQFFKYLSTMRMVCTALAPYQSATFRSVLLSTPVAESASDQSAAERLIEFFDKLADSAVAEKPRKAEQPVRVIEGTLVRYRS